MKKFLIVISLLFLTSIAKAQATELVLGDPSPSTASSDNILIKHSTYILSFNKKRLSADWVAWHTQVTDLGCEDRSNDFRPDTALPKSFRISGATFDAPYDRGHACPSGDRTKTKPKNSETFLMSNMEAQHKNLNRKTWKTFEEYTREVIREGNEAYIYAGCGGGTKKLKKNGMTIPTYCWKVVLFLPRDKDDLSRIDKKTRVVAIDMPNDGSTEKAKWFDYRTSVGAIEAKTKLDFFTNLPNAVSSSLKQEIDGEDIPKPTKPPKCPKKKKQK